MNRSGHGGGVRGDRLRPFSRGRGRGGGGTSGPGDSKSIGIGLRISGRSPVQGISSSATPDSVPTDLVRPILPPLYPDYVDEVVVGKLDPTINMLVPEFANLKKYFKVNYSVQYLAKKECAFEVPRYTDNYADPHLVEPRLLYSLGKKFFPKELNLATTKVRRKVVKVVNEAEILDKYTDEEKQKDIVDSDDEATGKKRRFDEDVGDLAKAEKLEIQKVAKSLEDPELGDVDDDEEEEVDEEMDEGNDYQNDYFDNGEDYLSEDDNLEDGDVF